MTANNTLEQLKELKLMGMHQALREQLEQPLQQDLSFHERLALLVDRERLLRHNGSSDIYGEKFHLVVISDSKCEFLLKKRS